MYIYIYIYSYLFSSPGKFRSNGNQQQTEPPIGGTGAQVKRSTIQKMHTCRKSRAQTLTLHTKTILRLCSETPGPVESALMLESVLESVLVLVLESVLVMRCCWAYVGKMCWETR